jgi:CheY-like chemotaxis protein
MPTPQNQPPKSALKITAAERPNTLGLHQRDLVSLIELLEAQDKGKPTARRDFTRWPFRHATIRVTLLQPSGAEVNLKLACRNLSRGGVSLLHNAFVHPGSQVVVHLPRLAGGVKDCRGAVKRCQHRRGVLHELGIRFEEEVDLREFLGGGNGVEFFSLEHVNPEKLEGTILYVDDNEVDVRIFKHFLRETSLSVVTAENGTKAIEEAARSYDVIVADWKLPDIDGTKVIEMIREQGIQTPVLLVTANPMELMRSGLWDQPGTGLLAKPLSQTQLLRALGERLMLSKKQAGEQAVASGAEERAALTDAMQMQFALMGEDIERAVTANTLDKARAICTKLRGSAPAVGLESLARLAERAENLLAKDPAQGAKVARELASACKALKVAA